MTFEDLRKLYLSDLVLARALFEECQQLRADLRATESMLQLREAQRRRGRQDEIFVPR